MRIVFFGTPAYAEHILNFLIDHKLDIVAIVTRPDKPKGRSKKLIPPPVKTAAQKRLPTVPIYQPAKASTPEFAETLKGLKADLFVVIAYGEIIKQFLLDIPLKGCINVHFSLLPRWRGAAPMQHTLMAGDAETGVSVIEMVLAMDAGDILGEAKISISENMTCGELAQKLCELAGPLLLHVIDSIKKNTINRRSQDNSKKTLAPKITPHDAKLDWSQNALALHNKVRALNPAPGAWCEAKVGDQIKRLKILRTEMILGHINKYSKGEWIESCGQDALKILEVQLEGKRAMLTKDFMVGVHQIKILKY